MADYLNKRQANYSPLNPVQFLDRSAEVYPNTVSVIYGDTQYTWSQTYARCRQLASALQQIGIKKGDTVSFLAANTPELYEAHFGVPMLGAVLNAINCRLDAETITYILEHSQAKVLFCDTDFSQTAARALASLNREIVLIDIDDPTVVDGQLIGSQDYQAFISSGDPDFDDFAHIDEWDNLALNYTSGTTGRPKGVLYHYRGAYLTAISNILEWDMPKHPTYLWTLPMFHCNGWCFPWSIAARAGTNVCLRKVSGAHIFGAIAENKVDHFCGAPIVLSMVINTPNDERREFDHQCNVMTAAAPPPASVLQKMQQQGFVVTHVYGLTETYGPATVCAWQLAWNELPIEQQAVQNARQGVNYSVGEAICVMDSETMQAVPHDGETMGEVMFRGNNVMKGYLDNPDASDESFAGGWFHSGDLGVCQPDGYIQLKDRAKDIIISGGENISSIEVESCIYAHPQVAAVAVVAKPDEKWGETPCAFVELEAGLKAGETPLDETTLIAFCRDKIAHFKCPTKVVFTELPKTSTGKIQKFELRQQV